jgi:hypothetical protein
MVGMWVEYLDKKKVELKASHWAEMKVAYLVEMKAA